MFDNVILIRLFVFLFCFCFCLFLDYHYQLMFQQTSSTIPPRPRLEHCYCCCCLVGWLVGWLTSQQHSGAPQGRICSDNCCKTETVAADQTCCLTQSQYADTGPTSPSADSVSPSTWQASPGIFRSLVRLDPEKKDPR